MLEDTVKNPLIAAICDDIAASDGRISFHHYMESCLYHPEYGYYMQDRPKVGKSGDFYTSASIGGIMGEMVAKHFADRAANWEVPVFSEWGAGTGQMAKSILDTLAEKQHELYLSMRYIIVEKSGYHRRELEAALQDHRERLEFMTEEEWMSQTPHRHVYLFSNELLDAFPVYRVKKQKGLLYEIGVEWSNESGGFIETLMPFSNPDILEYLSAGEIELRENQEIEVNVAGMSWLKKTCHSLTDSVLVAVDYGDVSQEIHSAHRMKGTLMCYRNHLAHDNPFVYPGEQDITAHVDFSACIRAGQEGGAAAWSLKTQRDFLLQAGVLELLSEHGGTDPFSPAAKRNRAIRQLLLGDTMSELFKVLELTIP
ncbi:class I SAM-dependent methyltransferase [Gorillibacterium massiliense]|uniref:class I SAM-dependent methyltransferase n=1 Tax=Gorillibacterium massiliense TaxID=1280390 RepID=UPI0004B586CB|nr:SAM-dependent methyltransferase [Gorillibacterium massiliense]